MIWLEADAPAHRPLEGRCKLHPAATSTTVRAISAVTIPNRIRLRPDPSEPRPPDSRSASAEALYVARSAGTMPKTSPFTTATAIVKVKAL